MNDFLGLPERDYNNFKLLIKKYYRGQYINTYLSGSKYI